MKGTKWLFPSLHLLFFLLFPLKKCSGWQQSYLRAKGIACSQSGDREITSVVLGKSFPSGP